LHGRGKKLKKSKSKICKNRGKVEGGGNDRVVKHPQKGRGKRRRKLIWNYICGKAHPDELKKTG